MRPTSIDELADVVRASDRLYIVGEDSHESFRLQRPLADTTRLEMRGLSGIIEFSPSDQVVEMYAGTSLHDLQHALAEHGQCLPMLEWYGGDSPLNFHHGTVGGGLSMGLWHELEEQCGGWRDWLLGATVILADGTVAKSGSRAVKNVAGYDIHKLFVGARGTLAVLAKAVLRTFPLRSLPEPSSVRGWDESRTKLELTDPFQIRFMKRAKEIFDPTRKLNPGEMGIF